MPTKKIEPFTFTFQYEGDNYDFDTYRIFYEGKFVCCCDLTATEYYGNKLVTLICCKIALKAYYDGMDNGKIEQKKEIAETFKDLLDFKEE